MQLKLYFDRELEIINIEPILYRQGILSQNMQTHIQSKKVTDSHLKMAYLTLGSSILFITVCKYEKQIIITDMLIDYQFLDDVLATGHDKQLVRLRKEIREEHEKVIQLQKEATEARIKNYEIQQLGQVTFQLN